MSHKSKKSPKYGFRILNEDWKKMPAYHACGGKLYKVLGPFGRPPRCSCHMSPKTRKQRYLDAKAMIKEEFEEGLKKFTKQAKSMVNKVDKESTTLKEMKNLFYGIDPEKKYKKYYKSVIKRIIHPRSKSRSKTKSRSRTKSH